MEIFHRFFRYAAFENFAKTVQFIGLFILNNKEHFIEEIDDWFEALKSIGFGFGFDTKVGLTAGASTPKEELFELKQLIENKQKELKNEN